MPSETYEAFGLIRDESDFTPAGHYGLSRSKPPSPPAAGRGVSRPR